MIEPQATDPVPLWIRCSMALEDAQSCLPGHLTHPAAASRRRTDQSLAPTCLADKGSRRLSQPIRTPPCCRERCVRPSAHLRTCTQEQGGHRDRRTASTPAMAAAAAKNIAKRSASYAHANPRLKQDTSAIMVSSRTLASNPALLFVFAARYLRTR